MRTYWGSLCAMVTGEMRTQWVGLGGGGGIGSWMGGDDEGAGAEWNVEAASLEGWFLLGADWFILQLGNEVLLPDLSGREVARFKPQATRRKGSRDLKNKAPWSQHLLLMPHCVCACFLRRSVGYPPLSRHSVLV